MRGTGADLLHTLSIFWQIPNCGKCKTLRCLFSRVYLHGIGKFSGISRSSSDEEWRGGV
ncbi:hypothetical protein BCEP27_30095 [Burkholderia cepacia]